MEEPTKFKTYESMLAQVNQALTLTKAAELEAVAAACDLHTVLVAQLTGRLVKSARTLNAIVTKREAAEKKAVENRLKEAQLERQAKLEVAAVQARKELQWQEDAHAFHIKWCEAGHGNIREFDDLVKLQESLSNPEKSSSVVLASPFILKKCTPLDDLLKPGGKMRTDDKTGLLDKWEGAAGFVKGFGPISDALQHTLSEAQGATK